MTRAKLSFVAVVFGWFLSLVLYGCDGGNNDGTGFPNVRGVYRGTITQPDRSCRFPTDDRVFPSSLIMTISSQNGADFSGTGPDEAGNTVSVAGQITADGGVSGSITFATASLGDAPFQVTFSGTLTGNMLTANYFEHEIGFAGASCDLQGQLTATRQ